MERDELITKIDLLKHKQIVALLELVEPAKAAANAMKDAGMKATSDHLFEAIFKVDVASQEIDKFLSDNLKDVINLVIKGIHNA